MWLFDTLVCAIMGHEVHIWRWKERNKIERVQDKFLKRIVRVRRCVLGYMVRERLQKLKLRKRAGMRTRRYKRKLGKRKGGKLARLCWKELRESKGEKSNKRLRGGKKRVLCGGVEAGEVERLREEKELREEKMVVREREEMEKEKWEEIRKSKFNKWYD